MYSYLEIIIPHQPKPSQASPILDILNIALRSPEVILENLISKMKVTCAFAELIVPQMLHFVSPPWQFHHPHGTGALKADVAASKSMSMLPPEK
jgi:hypothetical protein